MKAVLFDLFETLITEWVTDKVTTRQIAQRLGVDYGEFRERWEALHEDRYLGKTKELGRTLADIVSAMGVAPDETEIRRIVAEREAAKAICFAAEHTEVDAMIHGIKRKGLRLGLVSNCSRDEIVSIRDWRLYEEFGSVQLSCEAGLSKPNPEIYLRCARELGVDPADCLFVGDGGSDELRGARAAGMQSMRAVWFSLPHQPDSDRDAEYPVAYEPMNIIEYIEGER